MPNRILRESIWTSESLASVSLLAEALFLKLIPYADDFGRFDARPAVVLGRLMPLRPTRVEQLETWLKELETAGMIRFYVVRGVRYGCIPSWDRWNEKRAKQSRWPAPEDADATAPVQADARTCEQMHADADKCASIRDTRHETRDTRSEREKGARGALSPSGFKRPSVDEVRAEVERRHVDVDAEEFVAFYESKGWRIGTAPMRSWPAALTTWVKRAAKEAGGNGKRPRWAASAIGKRDGGDWQPATPEETAALEAARRSR